MGCFGRQERWDHLMWLRPSSYVVGVVEGAFLMVAMKVEMKLPGSRHWRGGEVGWGELEQVEEVE